MKKIYKIYFWIFICDKQVRKDSVPIPSPIDSPDFDTECEAEKWLIEQEDNPKFIGVEKYFVISPTFKMEAG